jgi:shikimate kinase
MRREGFRSHIHVEILHPRPTCPTVVSGSGYASAVTVFLIGMPASGKTTVGRRLAKLMGAKFVDLDAKVVEETGISLKEIFRTEGEWGFRVREATALLDVAGSRGSLVVATGGGAPTFGENLAVMARSGAVVYLRAKVATLAARPGLLSRPILAAHPGGPIRGLQSLFRLRRASYDRAEIAVDVDSQTPSVLARAIAEVLGSRPRRTSPHRKAGARGRRRV